MAEDPYASWVGNTIEPFSVDTYPYDTISDCTLEIQLWTTVSEKEMKTAKITQVFIGALHLNGTELAQFLCDDPFYVSRFEGPLKKSKNVPKNQLSNVCTGTLTLVGGRSGFMKHPNNYHCIDIPKFSVEVGL